ncbi:MAG TPA: DUF3592 domain-containing protein [Propionibacteriaceae bacterium]
MKVLKILAVVFGVILLLTGAGLLFGSYAAGKGDDVVQRQLQSSGLAGPVDGTVTAVEQSQVTVDYTDQDGKAQTGQGQAALTKPAKVGDTVSVYYSPDAPEIVVVTDLFGGSLTKVASGLKTGGVICLVLGAVLLLGGIVGLVAGKKKPTALPPGPSPQGQPAQYPNQGYPAQGPPQNYPPQPYPPQPYPPQNYPPQNYPPQPPTQPYPPQPYPPQNYPPQGPPSAR